MERCTSRYAHRRAARILLTYWVAFAAILLLATGSRLVDWWQLPVHALLLQGLVPGEPKNLHLVAWSLGVEAIFYGLVPLAAWAIRRMAHDGAVALGRLVTGILGAWCLPVAFGFPLAAAFPMHAWSPAAGRRAGLEPSRQSGEFLLRNGRSTGEPTTMLHPRRRAFRAAWAVPDRDSASNSLQPPAPTQIDDERPYRPADTRRSTRAARIDSY